MRRAMKNSIRKLIIPLLLGPASLLAQPHPDLPQFESQMNQYGDMLCTNLKNPNYNPDFALAGTYYDAELVFFNIFDYTGASKWLSCTQAAEKIYRDKYVIGNNGGVPGYWIFSHGILEDFKRSSDPTSRSALQTLMSNAAYARPNTPVGSLDSSDMSREAAYVMMLYLNSEKAGYPRNSRLNECFLASLGHLDQWFISKTADYIRPFMFALTSQALIQYYEQVNPDPRILPGIKAGCDYVMNSMFIPATNTLQYTNVDTSKFPPSHPAYNTGGKEPAPDLNLLVAPVYGWLYQRTGNVIYKDFGDKLFSGGVKQAYLVNGKQFNQNYRWSFRFLKDRESATPAPTVIPTQTPAPTATNTPVPTSTPTATATYTPTATPTSTPIDIVLPYGSYRIIQLD